MCNMTVKCGVHNMCVWVAGWVRGHYCSQQSVFFTLWQWGLNRGYSSWEEAVFILFVLLLIVLYVLPEGRRANRHYPGWDETFMMQVAFFCSQPV